MSQFKTRLAHLTKSSVWKSLFQFVSYRFISFLFNHIHHIDPRPTFHAQEFPPGHNDTKGSYRTSLSCRVSPSNKSSKLKCHGMTMCWSRVENIAKMNIANAAMWQRFGFFQLISIARLEVEDKHDSKRASELRFFAYPSAWFFQGSHSTSKNPTHESKHDISFEHHMRTHLTYKRLHPFSTKYYHCTSSRSSLKTTGNVATPYNCD